MRCIRQNLQGPRCHDPAKHRKFIVAPRTVQPQNGYSTRDLRLHSVAVADTGASHTSSITSVAGGKRGRQLHPSQALQIEQFIGHQIESTRGAW